MSSNPETEPDITLIERKLERLVGLFVAIVGILLFLFGAVSVQIALMVPKFERMFADLLGDKPLPTLTQWVIGWGRLGGGTAMIACSVLLPMVVLAFLVIRRNDPRAWFVAVATIVVLVLGNALAAVALYLPMIAITTELGAP